MPRPPPIEHLQAREFRGIVFMADQPADLLADAVVAVRSSGGSVFKTKTDKNGEFSLLDLPEGRYEAAVCLDGFNPWRGFVELSHINKAEPLRLPVRLGT